MLQRLKLAEFAELHKDRAFRVPKEFRDDKQVMIKIVSKNSQALSYASKELQNDRDIVMAAIQQQELPFAPLALQYASKKLRGGRRIARTALQHGHGINIFVGCLIF